ALGGSGNGPPRAEARGLVLSSLRRSPHPPRACGARHPLPHGERVPERAAASLLTLHKFARAAEAQAAPQAISSLGGFLAVLGVGEDALGDQARGLPDRCLDLLRDVGIGLEKRLGVLAALADALAVVGEPRAGFLHHARLDPEVEDLAGFRDALAVHDVELDLFERRRELVLD